MKHKIKVFLIAGMANIMGLSVGVAQPSNESSYQPTIKADGYYIDPTWRDVSYREIDLKIKGDVIIAYKDPLTGRFVDCNISYHKMTPQEKSQMKLYDSQGRSYEYYIGGCEYIAEIGKLTVYFGDRSFGYTNLGGNEIYTLDEVDTKPSCGSTDIIRSVIKRVDYPSEAVDKNIQGKVIASFIVNKDGEISDIKIIQSAHPILDKAVTTAIKKLGKCEPAKMNSKKVNTKVEFPFTFKLSQ